MSEFFIKNKKYIYVIASIIAVYYFMKYLIPLVIPLIIALLFVVPLHPWLGKVEEKVHIGKGFVTGVLILLLAGLLLVGIWALCTWLIHSITIFADNIDSYEEQFCIFVKELCGMIEEKVGFNAVYIENMVFDRVDIFIENLQIQVLPGLMNDSLFYVTSVAKAFAFLAITIISAILLAKDYDKILDKLRQDEHFDSIRNMVQKIGKMITTFVKAQVIILSVISIICSIGFACIGLKNPIGIGILTGALDTLPFVGTGIVLIPMAIWNLIQGEYIRALICLVIFIVCAVAREFLEPKLIGQRLGIFPVIILIAIYAGVKLYGLVGIILGPLSVLIVMEMHKKKTG